MILEVKKFITNMIFKRLFGVAIEITANANEKSIT